MNSRLRPALVAAVSFAFTYLFFFEYLPPFRRVHIPYDLRFFHYTLADYAFQALRHGTIRTWDATVFCGLSFAGNPQAAMFYPPTWVMFAANIGRSALSYQSLEDLVFVHVWLAFFLCYLWLRDKKLAELANILGAGVFAYSGYLVNQLQHMGLVAGYAWMPLGMWGIDQAIGEKRWRPLWKVVAAAALCLMAGHTPFWFVFCVCMMGYAAWRWKVALGVMLAIAASLIVAAVQVLPTYQAAAMKAFEVAYTAAYASPKGYLSYLLPNYFDFGFRAKPLFAIWSGDYLYLGAPAFLGLAVLIKRRNWRDLGPCLTMLTVVLIVATNPFGLVWGIIRHSNLLAQLCRGWYFLAGFTLAAAPLTAYGIDWCLSRRRRPVPGWLVALTCAALAAWSARQLLVWLPVGSDFPTGWNSAIAPAVALALFSAAIYILPSQKGPAHHWLMAAILLAVGVDYKVYGTSRWVNADLGRVSSNYKSIPHMDDAVFQQLHAHAEYRIALDLSVFFPAELRHYGLTTPQGFEPFVTTQYKSLMARSEHFRSEREIDLDPDHEALLNLLGVRYFLTAEDRPLYQRLMTNPHFRRLEPTQEFYRVFEFSGARPPYGWELEGAERTALCIRWTEESRAFLVRSDTGGRFRLSEQFFPGWHAAVDGKKVPIERWNEAFQAADVPAGEHSVTFTFQPPSLRAGVLVSLGALLALSILAIAGTDKDIIL